MNEAAAELQARSDLFDLTTSPERLAEIAREYPQFASYISSHPNSYPELKAWAQETLKLRVKPAPSLTPPSAADLPWTPEPLPDPYAANVSNDPWASYPHMQLSSPGTHPVGTNTMAVLSLVFAFVLAPLGIVFGFVARNQIRRTGEAGAGLATAGIALGSIMLMFGVFGMLAMIMFTVAVSTI